MDNSINANNLFSIILDGRFRIIDIELDPFEKEPIYTCSHQGNPNSDFVNIIIGDTYPIKMSQIPDSVRDNYSSIIQRDPIIKGRIYSPKLISLAQTEILKIQNKKMNIFWNTNPLTTKALIENIFKTGGRDKYHLTIYQYDTETKKFLPKKIIKC